MGTPRRRFAAALCVVGSLLLAGTAAAQSDEEIQRARETFAEGLELAEQEQWQQAADAFRQVLEVKSTPQVKYNLALALVELGELTRAAELFDEVEADPDTDRRLERQAGTAREELEPRLATLRVSVAGDAAGATVKLDGEELPPEDWDRAVPIDPGTHELVLTGRGREPSTRSITVPEGEDAEVELVPGPEAAARSALDPELAGMGEDADAGEGDSIWTEWWLWTAVGAVVVVGAAVIIGVTAGGGGGNPSPEQGDLDPPILEVQP